MIDSNYHDICLVYPCLVHVLASQYQAQKFVRVHSIQLVITTNTKVATIDCLLYARHYVKQLTNIISFNPYMRKMLLLSFFHRWGSWLREFICFLFVCLFSESPLKLKLKSRLSNYADYNLQLWNVYRFNEMLTNECVYNTVLIWTF